MADKNGTVFFTTIGRHLECAIQTELVVELELARIERKQYLINFGTILSYTRNMRKGLRRSDRQTYRRADRQKERKNLNLNADPGCMVILHKIGGWHVQVESLPDIRRNRQLVCPMIVCPC